MEFLGFFSFESDAQNTILPVGQFIEFSLPELPKRLGGLARFITLEVMNTREHLTAFTAYRRHYPGSCTIILIIIIATTTTSAAGTTTTKWLHCINWGNAQWGIKYSLVRKRVCLRKILLPASQHMTSMTIRHSLVWIFWKGESQGKFYCQQPHPNPIRLWPPPSQYMIVCC